MAQYREFFQSRLINWHLNNRRNYPWRDTSDPFKVLIAEIVLRITGAWKSERIYSYLIEKYGTPEKMALADPLELYAAFKPLGLHNRAFLLIDIAKDLIRRFHGNVPATYSSLVSIKGIGRYTANAVLCFAFGQRVPLVDESISRIFKRCFGFVPRKAAYADTELWSFAHDLLPATRYCEYNLALLDLGALVCTHKRPRCAVCPIAEICKEYHANQNF